MTDEEKVKAANELIKEEIFKALDQLEIHLKNFCRDTEKTDVPFVYVHITIERMKSAFTEAVSRKKTPDQIIQDTLDGKDTEGRVPLSDVDLSENDNFSQPPNLLP